MKVLKSLSLVALMMVVFSNCNAQPKNEEKQEATAEKHGVIYLDAETFKAQVFDYENNKEWKYLGDKPAILDFYADWCGPCKMLAPHLEEIQKEYGSDLQVYKIDTDHNRDLAMAFGIQSLPTIVFVPAQGQPTAVMGYRNKEALEGIITEVLQVKKAE